MNAEKTTRISKMLSYVLRHRPDAVGINLDEAGWTPVDELLDALRRDGKPVTREQLEFVVENNDKKRFEFSYDGEMIRASQGHSIDVDLRYEPAEPPEFLFHGTVSKFLETIRLDGLNKGKRHDVHLSTKRDSAKAVGSRRGKPVILTIRAQQMHEKGHEFFVTPNGVWLTDHVRPEFIEFP